MGGIVGRCLVGLAGVFRLRGDDRSVSSVAFGLDAQPVMDVAPTALYGSSGGFPASDGWALLRVDVTQGAAGGSQTTVTAFDGTFPGDAAEFVAWIYGVGLRYDYGAGQAAADFGGAEVRVLYPELIGTGTGASLPIAQWTAAEDFDLPTPLLVAALPYRSFARPIPWLKGQNLICSVSDVRGAGAGNNVSQFTLLMRFVPAGNPPLP